MENTLVLIVLFVVCSGAAAQVGWMAVSLALCLLAIIFIAVLCVQYMEGGKVK